MERNDKQLSANELTETVSKLFNSDKFSDISIKLQDGGLFTAHKIVLYSRGDDWSNDSLSKVTQLNWQHIDPEISLTLLKWLYTYELDPTLVEDEDFTLNLMNSAGEFKLTNLIKKCESKLIELISVKNCIKFYIVSDKTNSSKLKNSASELISKNWKCFKSDDFDNVDARLLCEIVKANTKFHLHCAVRFHRKELVEFYLTENKAEISRVINEPDENGDLPLSLALSERQTDIADILCGYKADVNAKDRAGWALLQRAIQRGDTYTAAFLIEHNADVFSMTPNSGDTCLHLACAHTPPEFIFDDNGSTTTTEETMVKVGILLLEKGLNPSKTNNEGFSPLHIAVMTSNTPMFDLLLSDDYATDIDVQNKKQLTPLWYALSGHSVLDKTSFAYRLLTKGARIDIVSNENSGDSLLQLLILEKREDAAVFVLHSITPSDLNVNYTNTYGETALHLAAKLGLHRLVGTLVDFGADVNIQTLKPRPVSEDEAYTSFNQTPLHYAVASNNVQCVRVLTEHSKSRLDCNLRDSRGNTPLSLTLSLAHKQLVPLLLKADADINFVNADGYTLLHLAIINRDYESAIFLLDHGADMKKITANNLTPLHLCIQNRLPEVVEALCSRGVDMSVPNNDGDCPLWAALASGQEDIASILVKNGVDTDAWSYGPEGCFQTLLHKAIDENNQAIAKFLIQSGCDIDTPRRPSPEGTGGDEAKDGCTPLHLCCQWGLEDAVQTLLEHGASINKKDSEDKTPLHVAIQNQHKNLISLLLCHPNIDLTVRDSSGLTPFAAALTCRNNKAAQAILDKLPTAAEQFNKKGQNFLHTALQSNQEENVYFLLSINVDVNSRVRDSTQTPPLHLAAAAGNEVLLRSLILAGAKVNEVDAYKQTALHVAASSGHAQVVSALLQNDAKPDLSDTDGNNPLHIACKEGHLAVVKVLLTESTLDAEALNLKGRNPLHMLARYAKENAAAICEVFIDVMPDYPLDRADLEGNTALLLGYMKGNGNLCRTLVKAGACLGYMNKDGVTIFNYQVATKQLLYNLLDSLGKEPPWSEGDICLECGTKFGITMRKHHCRHCGRLLCNKCSDQDVPIIKYKLNKPVRVCAVCFDVLQVGAS